MWTSKQKGTDWWGFNVRIALSQEQQHGDYQPDPLAHPLGNWTYQQATLRGLVITDIVPDDRRTLLGMSHFSVPGGPNLLWEWTPVKLIAATSFRTPPGMPLLRRAEIVFRAQMGGFNVQFEQRGVRGPCGCRLILLIEPENPAK